MFGLEKEDNYKKLVYDPMTGGNKRQWLRYGDGVYEPVRKDGNPRDKWSDPQRQMSWWVEEKPESWKPSDDGEAMSLNHDYGEENKPGPKKSTSPQNNFLATFAKLGQNVDTGKVQSRSKTRGQKPTLLKLNNVDEDGPQLGRNAPRNAYADAKNMERKAGTVGTVKRKGDSPASLPRKTGVSSGSLWDAAGKIGSGLSDAFGKIGSGLDDAAEQVADGLGKASGQVADGLGKAGKQIARRGGEAAQKLAEDVPDAVKEALSEGFDAAGKSFGKLADEYRNNEQFRTALNTALAAGMAPKAAVAAAMYGPAMVAKVLQHPEMLAKGMEAGLDVVDPNPVPSTLEGVYKGLVDEVYEWIK